MENGGREREGVKEEEITIKRQIERVGVNRRRREKRFLSFKGVWRILGGGLIATQNTEQGQRVIGVEEEEKKHGSFPDLLMHSDTDTYILSSYTLIHPAGIFKECLLSKSTSFPLLLVDRIVTVISRNLSYSPKTHC